MVFVSSKFMIKNQKLDQPELSNTVIETMFKPFVADPTPVTDPDPIPPVVPTPEPIVVSNTQPLQTTEENETNITNITTNVSYNKGTHMLIVNGKEKAITKHSAYLLDMLTIDN
jgi:hypothetical protein